MEGFEASEVEFVQFMSLLMNFGLVFAYPLGLFVDDFSAVGFRASKPVEFRHFVDTIFAECRDFAKIGRGKAVHEGPHERVLR